MRIRKKFSVLLMVMTLSLAPVCATGMPVVDFTAAANFIQNMVQTMKEWKATVAHYKSEYDRIKKAAETIANGEWTEVVAAIGDLATQARDWDLFTGAYWDNVMQATADGSYSLLSMADNTNLLMQNMDKILKNFEDEHKKYEANKGEQSDAWLESGVAQVENLMDFIISIGDSASGMLDDASTMSSSLSRMFYARPADFADVFRQQVEKTLSNFTGETIFTSKDFRESNYWTQLKEELAQAKQDYAGLNASEDQNLIYQTEAKIHSLEKKIEDCNDLYQWAQELERKIKKLMQEEKRTQDQTLAKEASMRKASIVYEEAEKTFDLFKTEETRKRNILYQISGDLLFDGSKKPMDDNIFDTPDWKKTRKL